MTEEFVVVLSSWFFCLSCMGRPSSQWPAQAALTEKSWTENNNKFFCQHLTVPLSCVETVEGAPAWQSKSKQRKNVSKIVLKFSNISIKQLLSSKKMSYILSSSNFPSPGANYFEVSDIWGKTLGTRNVSENCQFLSKSQVLSVNFYVYSKLNTSTWL